MADYIKRSEAAEIICKMICGDDRALCVSAYKNCLQKPIIELYDIPAAKVREDVRGKWILSTDDLDFVDGKCSVCGYTDCFDSSPFYNFCPHCGADMRENNA